MMEEKWKLDRRALFTDETITYRFPADVEAGDEVTFRFRTRKDNVRSVVLYSRSTRSTMVKTFTQGSFDYYETKIIMGQDTFSYFFEVIGKDESCFYNKMGAMNADYGMYRNTERLFRVIPGFCTPDWAKGAVMYQIFVDRFRNGNPENDVLNREYSYIGQPVEKVEDWYCCPRNSDIRRFYGGDLQGVYEKLDYLKNLGVEVIYFNPLFVSPSNHKYDVQDYDYIDPHLVGFVEDGGDVLPLNSNENGQSERYVKRVTSLKNLEKANEYFAFLVKEIHKRGMKVIIDGVFNHCGSFNKWMDEDKVYSGKKGYEDGAFVSEDSPYKNYFIFESGSKWPNNHQYVGWWGHDTLPKLNYENSQELHDYVLRIAKKWLEPPYCVDGWRLDVAADLGQSLNYNHLFWRDFRKAVKEVNPNAIIIAEHYGNCSEWLQGGEWDTIMNYDAFMEPVGYFLTGMEKHSDEYNHYYHGNGREFYYNLMTHLCHMDAQSILCAMNELSNHDHSRFMTRTNCRKGRIETVGAHAAEEGISYATFREGIVMQFTLPGAPTIYYGDETGVVGWTDPDSRRTYPWGRENWELISFHKELIKIHKKYSCLKWGSFKPLDYGDGYVCYGRFDVHNAAVVVINHSDFDREIQIPVWELDFPVEGTTKRIFQTTDSGYNIGIKEVQINNGEIDVKLPAFSSTIYVMESLDKI